MMKKIENNMIAIQPTVLLECIEEMSDIEKMLVHFILNKIDEAKIEAEENPSFLINFPDLSIEKYKLLQESVLSLHKRDLTIFDDDQKKHYLSFRIFPNVEFKNNILMLTMLDKAAPYFLALKKYYKKTEMKEKLQTSDTSSFLFS